MITPRRLALALGVSRVAYAVALVAVPARAAGPWIGSSADSPGGRVAVRGLGFRDGVLAGAVAIAAAREQPLRPWLLACVASDLADVVATLLEDEGLPDGARAGTVALAGGTAAAGIAIAAAVDE